MRLVSLDVLRGLAIALMVLANNGVLAESDWNGLTLADCIFPTFVFVVGVAIPFSRTSKLRVTRRAAVLFILGFALTTTNWTFVAAGYGDFRLLGVLQRIALCYLFASIAFIYVKSRRARLVLVAAILVGYWLVMAQAPLTEAGNLAAQLDRALIGPSHMFNGVYDPEGLLSTLPAIATCLMGVAVGESLRDKKPVGNLVNVGIITIAVGAAWSVVFPLNKALWTSSFVLVVAGLDMLSLVLLSFVNERLSSPLEALGSNAIIIYCLNSIVNIYLHVPIVDNLERALVILAAWLLLSFALYKKRIFIRV
ncbi:MAG TPA: heparan-alpha-glucosaminide N-acetyltransferase domain-containing protein [candidate division Zixibacteria bacterium]|nr:heparan-alpha-glucosaminide N-acetyltransferase domain-containing protein [candidate division Zixibacteria bacterium]